MAGVERLQQPQTAVTSPSFLRRKTSKWASLLLSFLLPGLGAAYNGQTSKALVHFALFASSIQLATMTNAIAFFVLSSVAVWLFAAVDAYRTAELLGAGLAPGAESDAIARRLYGSPLTWAILMITLGSVFTLHTLFGVRLPIRQLLPLALVGLGVYMLTDLLRARRAVGTERTFERLPAPPSAIAGNTAALEVMMFRTGDLSAPSSATDTRRGETAWPFEPRV